MHPDLPWTSQQYHFILSLSTAVRLLCLSLYPWKLLARRLHHNHDSVEEKVWIRPKCRVMSAEPWLPASHAWATMEIKSVKKRMEEGGEKKNNNKKTKSTPLHTPLTSILSLRLMCKRIAERMSRSKTRKQREWRRQTVILALPRLSHYNVHGW